MKPDPRPWACDLSQLFGEVWTRLTRGVHDRHAPARHPTLATVTPKGRPQARTVVLRAAYKAAGTLDIYTDLRPAKVRDLRVTPFAALEVWDTSALFLDQGDRLSERRKVMVNSFDVNPVGIKHEGTVIPSMVLRT